MFPSCSSCAARKIACRYAEHAIPNLSLEGADPRVALVQAPPEYEKARGSDVERYSLETQMGAQENFEFSVFDADGLTDGFRGLGRPEISDFDFGLSEMSSDVLPTNPIFNHCSPPSSLQWKSPKVLERRSLDSPQVPMASMMLGQIIASFPYMMTRKETFPPFIHPRCHDSSRGSSELPEILKDCMGLAHMFHTKTKESNKMFWRSVRMEQEKLYAQVRSCLDALSTSSQLTDPSVKRTPTTTSKPLPKPS
jgi:hypothetical protein